MQMITVLDKITIDQIAAGEVIERPASVVKELTENALDAGATAITIEFKEGGLSLIRITDNGCGIDASEVKTAFLRHATSKIKNASDLMKLTSLGFRGEALSSIASIARVEILTKTQDAFTGIRYVIEGGEEKAFEETGCPNGTTFLVKDIFFNTPVRRKFLKSSSTEAGYICETVEKLALSHTDISFKLIGNGRVILHTTGKGKIRDDFLELYGLDIAKALMEIKEENTENEIKVDGVVAKPYISRGNRELEAVFINGRFVRSKVVANALEDAYKGYMMGHSYPVAAIYITCPADFVDVNVHPSKLEIRFSDNDMIYKLVYKAVRDALTGKNMIVSNILKEEKEIAEGRKARMDVLNSIHIPEPFENKVPKEVIPVSVAAPEKAEIKKPEIVSEYGLKLERPEIKEKPVQKPAENVEHETVETKAAEEKPAVHDEKEPDPLQELLAKANMITDAEQTEIPLDLYKEKKLEFRLVGQVFKTYWIIEMGDTVFMIDQHAAHEKVLFEKTMKKLRAKEEFMSQTILPPAVISLSMREAECLIKNMSVFQKLGFELEEFGPREFKVTGVPAELVDIDYDVLFKEILEDLLTGRDAKNPETMLDRIATISCKAAVKGNNYLSFEEADALIREMFELEDPYHCPHGRPTTISMTKSEMEKKFKRVL
ncbi:MAG: DNA mismatch repair endonuclease MutL [Lachnospiraceae bacterium]|nr:DNA mismatch repair endonuclease MutL [Lachnospiraceae bacterium]